MDRRFVPYAFVLLLLTAPSVLAQEEPPAAGEEPEAPAAAEPVAITMLAHQEGSSFYFTQEGQTQRNPTLTLPPNTEVTVTLRSVSGFHNIHVEGNEPSEYVSDGAETTYTFTTPESGTVQYWCDPHRSSGMVGRINVQAGGAGGAGGEAPVDAPTEYNLVAHQENGAFFFTIEGESQRNPTLLVKPGAQITINLRSASGFHNIHVEGNEPSEFVQEGESTTYTFTAPESGSVQYWCDPHRSSGMVGRVSLPTAGGGGGGGQGPEVSGPAVDLGELGFSDCAGYMIPQSAASGTVGGPTVADYVEQCRAGDQEVQTTRSTHVADYIIPATWVLIGLGIVAAVWVNRRYDP